MQKNAGKKLLLTFLESLMNTYGSIEMRTELLIDWSRKELLQKTTQHFHFSGVEMHWEGHQSKGLVAALVYAQSNAG